MKTDYRRLAAYAIAFAAVIIAFILVLVWYQAVLR